MTTLSPRATEVVAAAHRILEDEGPEALTMRRVADELAIQAPSLYKHLPNKRAIEVALIDSALTAMGEALHAAIARRARGAGIAPLLDAYRAQGLAHPNLYRLATSGPLPRDELTPGLEDWAGEPFFLVTGDPQLAQALWSFAHGALILELDARYPAASDLDSMWAAGAAAFRRAATARR